MTLEHLAKGLTRLFGDASARESHGALTVSVAGANLIELSIFESQIRRLQEAPKLWPAYECP